MCTVSYLTTDKGVIITSNRDENSERGNAFEPVIENNEGYQLIYPKDPKAGGTWIALKNNGDVAVLLNGAFENHIKKSSYRKSRGNILQEIIRSPVPAKAFEEIDLTDIENFTLILYKNNELLDYRWDGLQKHREIRNAKEPHIWSSATLYPHHISKQREEWFKNWLANTSHINQYEVIDFHHSAGKGNIENGLVMQRTNNISTVSITSISLTARKAKFYYKDLKANTIKQLDISLINNSLTPKILEKWKVYLRIAAIKTFNWEYWPMHLVYAPMYLYWFYLSAKARTFFFFSAANPARKNAGFAMEKKSDSYLHLPQKFYPKTILCDNGTPAPKLKMMITDHDVDFPLIAKPDIGERGIGVKLIDSLANLVDYSKKSNANFLLQQFIDYPNEVGIFYHRLPTAANGKITGIVGKEFLSITGDGKSSINILLKKSDRHLLHLKDLEEIYGNKLEQVLPLGEKKILVPYGNHCRGAKFIDLSFKINDKLTEVIDNCCKQIPEFHFGRLDIKFLSWEALEKGEKFSIIELNGAASEPTHIYDPKHSIFFAWKEIKKHWDLLYKISRINAENKSIKLMSNSEGMKMLNEHSKYIKNFSKS
jgi:hypothetical protein